MFAEKKLLLITEILKVENNNVLDELESILARATYTNNKHSGLKEYTGIMNNADADELQAIIEDGCGIKSINK